LWCLVGFVFFCHYIIPPVSTKEILMCQHFRAGHGWLAKSGIQALDLSAMAKPLFFA